MIENKEPKMAKQVVKLSKKIGVTGAIVITFNDKLSESQLEWYMINLEKAQLAIERLEELIKEIEG
jgi:hypothetical protein